MFLTAHGEDKKALRREIEELREELALLAGRTGKASGFDWGVEFYEAFGDGSGFDVVVANPPYVRADAQFRHVEEEEERQAEIKQWQDYRKMLKASHLYETCTRNGTSISRFSSVGGSCWHRAVR